MTNLRVCTAVLALWLSGLTTIWSEEFPQTCIPYPKSDHHPIDDGCGVDGDPGGSDNSKAQDRVKNNLCAVGSTNVLRLADFDRLQIFANTLKAHDKLHFGSPTGVPHV